MKHDGTHAATTLLARRIALVLLLAGSVLASASCADLQLRQYRDDRLLEDYHYTLGEQFLCVNGMRFCYQEFGQGETILILPGLGTSIDYWQEVIPTLAAQYHVVAVDPPGFGKSDKPNASYELAWIVDQVVVFMDAKGIHQASVIGGSMGGHLALLMALNHPDHVSKLVLMGSVGDWEPPGIFLDATIRLLWNDTLATNFLRERWPEIFPKMFHAPTPLTDRIFRYDMALRARGSRYAPQGRAASRAFRSILYSSCRERLKDVPQPTLLIWGEGDAIHPAPGTATYFREHLPNARLVVVPEAAHEVMVDQPETFSRLVLTFLQSGLPAIEERFPPTADK